MRNKDGKVQYDKRIKKSQEIFLMIFKKWKKEIETMGGIQTSKINVKIILSNT